MTSQLSPSICPCKEASQVWRNHWLSALFLVIETHFYLGQQGSLESLKRKPHV